MFKPHLEKARQYWTELLKPNDAVIDATCGNGKDTAFLASLVPQGQLVSIDIQETALIKARSLAPPNVTFLHQSHTDLPSIKDLKLVVYNLGYLPGGDKTITTMTESTLQSLAKAAELVVVGGGLSITCYPGHPEGAIEEKAVERWVNQLNFEKWHVFYHQWRAGSPTLFFIVKLKI